MDPVCLNRRGFTLIEFLVSIVILMVGLLGLLQTINVALSENLKTQVRNEAVVVVDEEMAKELAKGYDGINLGENFSAFRNYTVSKKMMNTFKLYSVSKTGDSLQNSKQVAITVSWKHKGQRYTHNATSVVTKTNQ